MVPTELLKVECAPLEHICGSFYNGLSLYMEYQIIYCHASLSQFNSRPQWLIFMSEGAICFAVFEPIQMHIRSMILLSLFCSKGSSFSKEYPESVDNPHFTLIHHGSIGYFMVTFASTNWKPIARHIFVSPSYVKVSYLIYIHYSGVSDDADVLIIYASIK